MIDGILIVLISIISSFVSEGISWVLIYRTEEYQKLKKSIESLEAKILAKKSEATDSKNAARKASALDEQLKNANRAMSAAKMKSTIFVGVVLIAVFGLISNMFEGIVVAKLPFEPFPMMRSMSHRGLSGSDWTDCSMMLIYVLCTFSIRANVQKYLGFTPIERQSMFAMPKEQ